jgi:hypothetical protein
MNYDTEKYLECMQPFVSDDSRRARRFIVSFCSLIVAASFLKVNFSRIKVVGINLSEVSELKVYVVAIVILLFWNILLYFHNRRDLHYDQERRKLMDDEIRDAESKYAERVKDNNMDNPFGKRLQSFVQLHREQRQRTKKLSFFQKAISIMDNFLPCGLSFLALVILSCNTVSAL